MCSQNNVCPVRGIGETLRVRHTKTKYPILFLQGNMITKNRIKATTGQCLNRGRNKKIPRPFCAAALIAPCVCGLISGRGWTYILMGVRTVRDFIESIEIHICLAFMWVAGLLVGFLAWG